MKIEQIYTKCLAQGAYYITCKGEAAIIDPLREVQPYIEKLKKDNVKLKYIFETHFHADFVSGHLSLSEETAAPIIYGPEAKPNFKAYIAKDNEIFPLGNITIKALHTPGHTMESTSYLLCDENGKQIALFSGDTLFLGDVGRPDLAQHATGLSSENLAGILYDSLHNKILPLSEEVIIYPGHGAGSACGKNMMKETFDTLKNQKKVNYALREDMTKEEFIKEVTSGIAPPPAYFPQNAMLNKKGYTHFNEVLEKGLCPLSVEEFEKEQINAVVLDTRPVEQFAKAHIPKSVFIGLDGNFAPWVGSILKDVQCPIILVCEHGREQEAVIRLSRVGFDNVKGFLKGGISAWINKNKEVDRVHSICAEQFATDYTQNPLPIIDVRKETEFNLSHIDKAISFPLSDFDKAICELKSTPAFYIHCAGGYRSMIAASLLKRENIHQFYDVKGGFQKIKDTTLKINHL